MRPDAAAPRVSAIICTHDDATRVPELVAQIAGIARPGVEVIVVDDASSDATADLLDAALADLAPAGAVRLLRRSSNGGAARARNTGLEAARGAHLWFGDSDDTWSPEILEVLLAAADATGADLVVARATLRSPTGPGTGSGGGTGDVVIDGAREPALLDTAGAVRGLLLGSIQGYLWTKLFSAHLFADWRFPAMRTQEDFMAVLNAVTRARAVALVPDVLYTYRLRAGSLSSSPVPAFTALRLATAEVLALQGRSPELVDDDALRYFRTWFLDLAVLETPPREGVEESWRREARAHLGPRTLVACWRHGRRVALRAVAVVVLRDRVRWARAALHH